MTKTVDKANDEGTGTYGVVAVPTYGGQATPVGEGKGSDTFIPGLRPTTYPHTGLGIKTASRLYNDVSRIVEIPMSYQAQNPALTYGFGYFPQVTPGKIWEVLKISAQQNDPWAAALANALLAFRMPQQLQDVTAEPPSFGAFLGSLGTLAAAPGIVTFAGGKVIYVQGNERVALVSKGLANGVQLIGSMEVIEHEKETFLKMLMGR
jgi:hypothetical protein